MLGSAFLIPLVFTDKSSLVVPRSLLPLMFVARGYLSNSLLLFFCQIIINNIFVLRSARIQRIFYTSYQHHSLLLSFWTPSPHHEAFGECSWSTADRATRRVFAPLPRRALVSVMLTCHALRPLAEKRLYWHLEWRYGSEWTTTHAPRPSSIHLLLRSFRENPPLAQRVRSISLQGCQWPAQIWDQRALQVFGNDLLPLFQHLQRLDNIFGAPAMFVPWLFTFCTNLRRFFIDADSGILYHIFRGTFHELGSFAPTIL